MFLHFIIFENDTETTSHKAWSYPRIHKIDTTLSQNVGCPEDAKVCGDGSIVTRNPDNNCEFDLCPDLFDHPGTIFYAVFMSFWGMSVFIADCWFQK